MEIRRFEISGLCLLTPRRFEDDRGLFAEVFNARALTEVLGPDAVFVQDNLSRSRRAGTVRALHFQKPPNAQGKLVRVSQGAIRDVAVDLRVGSETYGHHLGVDLVADALELFWVPPGFAHGFVTLAPDTEVTYKTTAYYSPEDEAGIAWDDPDLAIDWGVTAENAVLADRDRVQPAFADLGAPFQVLQA